MYVCDTARKYWISLLQPTTRTTTCAIYRYWELQGWCLILVLHLTTLRTWWLNFERFQGIKLQPLWTWLDFFGRKSRDGKVGPGSRRSSYNVHEKFWISWYLYFRAQSPVNYNDQKSLALSLAELPIFDFEIG